MNPKDQRIAIAKACGWKEHDHPDVAHLFEGWITAGQWMCDPEGVPEFLHKIPDYLNDLNAMHSVELNYMQDKYDLYESHLHEISGDPTYATAAQRAEAFLKTLNLWTNNS